MFRHWHPSITVLDQNSITAALSHLRLYQTMGRVIDRLNCIRNLCGVRGHEHYTLKLDGRSFPRTVAVQNIARLLSEYDERLPESSDNLWDALAVISTVLAERERPAGGTP